MVFIMRPPPSGKPERRKEIDERTYEAYSRIIKTMEAWDEGRRKLYEKQQLKKLEKQDSTLEIREFPDPYRYEEYEEYKKRIAEIRASGPRKLDSGPRLPIKDPKEAKQFINIML